MECCSAMIRRNSTPSSHPPSTAENAMMVPSNLPLLLEMKHHHTHLRLLRTKNL